MAERVGFEPTSELSPLHDFQSCSLDQLGHRSARCGRAEFYHIRGSESTRETEVGQPLDMPPEWLLEENGWVFCADTARLMSSSEAYRDTKTEPTDVE